MPGTLLVMSDPVAGKEQEYDTWYQQQHLVDVVAVPGVARAQRFRLADEDAASSHRFLAVYELDGEPADVMAELGRRVGTEAMPMSEAMDMTSVVMTLWRTHGGAVQSA